eukprot:m.213278 g.213278  ORF g.213278 m.213278 type:complete len:157 (-) comp17175_c0_seq1:2130-2600(-)
MGEKDYIKQVACQLGGQVQYGRVFLKPGKPTTLITFPEPTEGAKVMLALPGNPLSTFVTFHLFVLRALRQLGGLPAPPATMAARLTADVTLDRRPEFQRVRLDWQKDDLPGVKPVPNVLSSRLLDASGAQALLCLPPLQDGPGYLKKGAVVSVLLL